MPARKRAPETGPDVLDDRGPLRRAVAGPQLSPVQAVVGGPWDGPVSWRKPTTFGVAFGLTLATITWVTTFVPMRERTRRIALTDFLVGNRKTLRRPGEILSQISVPRTVENAASTFLKLGARRYLVISIAMVAAVIQMDTGGRVTDARVAIGSCSVVARRLPDLEHALMGASAASGAASSTLGSLATADHLEDLSPVSDVRATAAYRRDAALRLVQRALDACAGSS